MTTSFIIYAAFILIAILVWGSLSFWKHLRKEITPSTTQLYNETAAALYNLLFCDGPWEQYISLGEEFPCLFSSPFDEKELLRLANNSQVESRTRVLAWRRLRELNKKPDHLDVLGVIVEYHLSAPKGLDTLAFYRDGSARYINYTGKIGIVDKWPNERSLQHLFDHADKIAQVIGWTDKRLPPPSTEQIRITLLVNGYLYTGQGPADIMFKDDLGGPLLQEATQMLQTLTASLN